MRHFKQIFFSNISIGTSDPHGTIFISLSFSTIKQTNPLSQFPTKTKLQPHFSLLGSSNPTPKPCILIHPHLSSPHITRV
ncbi:hypothetical protein P8452_04146 [Trifolium repens]|nr:hypothetical protein P8452_04146 [Trifolium repens]